MLLLALPILAGASRPGDLGAQTAPPSDLEASRLPELLGRQIRVMGPGTSSTGTLLSVHPQSLQLDAEAGTRTVLVGPSDSVWVMGVHSRQGALVGALAGIALTAGFCIESFDECGLDVGLLVVTPLFALAGAGFGALWPKWEKVVPP